MAEDRLRDFIQKNQEAFSTEKAPKGLWNEIEKDLDGKKTRNPLWNYLMILCIVCLCGGSVWYLQKVRSEGQKPTIEQQFAENSPQEFKDMENYYGKLLNDKKENVLQVAHDPSIVQELQNLDQGYDELKQDFLQSSSNNEELMMHLMIENYKLRIKLLELAMEKKQEDSIQPSQQKLYYNERNEY